MRASGGAHDLTEKQLRSVTASRSRVEDECVCDRTYRKYENGVQPSASVGVDPEEYTDQTSTERQECAIYAREDRRCQRDLQHLTEDIEPERPNDHGGDVDAIRADFYRLYNIC